MPITLANINRFSNLQQSVYYIAHHTLTVLLHYFAKSKLLILFCKQIYANQLFLDRLFLPTSYSRTWHQNKWRVCPGRAVETGDAVRYPYNFWRPIHFSAGQCTHRPIGLERRSRYSSERFRLSLLPICDLPTALASTLLTTRCGVRCRTTFIGRKCETSTI